MAKHERQSLYYNEDNLYLYHYVKDKRKSNDWVIELIRREYMREKGLVSTETTLTQTQSTPTKDQQAVELLTQQVQALAQQFATQQELFLKTQQALMTQPIAPMVKQEPIESTQETPNVSSSMGVEPMNEPTEPIVEPLQAKPSETGRGRLGNLKNKASKTKLQ